MKMKKRFKLVILSRSFAKSTDKPLILLKDSGIDYALKRNNEPENEEKIAEMIGDADAVIIGSERIGEVVFSRCKNLKVISKHGVGLDSVDLCGAKERNIIVTNTPDANHQSVADLTWLLILAASRNLLKNIVSPKTFDWKVSPLTNEVYKKTIGIIGYGKIGAAVARRGMGFDNRVLVFDPMVSTSLKVNGLDIKKVELNELLSQSDIITLHAPLNPQSKHMINGKAFGKMKDGVIIINTSRGGLIDESALNEALIAGKVKFAGVDVFSTEPPVGNPLLELDNVIATPHIGTHTMEANYRMGMAAVHNVVTELRKKTRMS